jgi:heme/copper-type cytochrome/quinol oxidase subunit 2
MRITMKTRSTLKPPFVRVLLLGVFSTSVVSAVPVPFAAATGTTNAPVPQTVTRRLIEIVADHDSQFRISGQSAPVISVTAGEPLRLRITAIKAKNKNRDGAVHGFTLLHAKDRTPVPGWDFELHPGTHDYDLEAPYEPGEYEVVCTVICSGNHEQMSMRFVVLPRPE